MVLDAGGAMALLERATYGVQDAFGELAEAHSDALLDYSRRMTEAVIAAIPDGVYQFEDAPEGAGQRDYRIPVSAPVTVDGSHMTLVFAGSAPQVLGTSQ